MKDCPNCGNVGEPIETNDTERYCDDAACPVITYDWDHGSDRRP